ncbi:MAG: hypothetical protein AABN95_27220 [Acidobacteriota bacterium]
MDFRIGNLEVHTILGRAPRRTVIDKNTFYPLKVVGHFHWCARNAPLFVEDCTN